MKKTACNSGKEYLRKIDWLYEIVMMIIKIHKDSRYSSNSNYVKCTSIRVYEWLLQIVTTREGASGISFIKPNWQKINFIDVNLPYLKKVQN